MLFPTMSFALFFVVVLGVSWRLNERPQAWKLCMLAASYVFYGAWNWRFLALIIGASVVNHLVTKAMEPRAGAARRAWLVVGLLANLGTLGYFKYYEFFTESLVRLLSPFGLEPHGLVKTVALPIAISFFTFQGLSYLIDVYRGDERTYSLLDVSLFLAFFPQLVAGPIVRTSEFMPELHSRRNPDGVDVARAVRLIGRGLIKKVVIASLMAQLVDPVFAAPGGYTAFTVFVAILAYAVQIYADFSGYTDIAIGVALLLGFHFPDNFDRPYASSSIQDFWRRWHMTLSRWLLDYLYIPLGGNQGGRARQYRNLILTMALGGLWHGASGTFIVWGLPGAWPGGRAVDEGPPPRGSTAVGRGASRVGSAPSGGEGACAGERRVRGHGAGAYGARLARSMELWGVRQGPGHLRHRRAAPRRR